MPIIRNPFRRAPDHIDENAHPTGTPGPLSRTSSEGKNSLDIKPVEYKLSEINDSGVYLPPSPTEKQSFWSMRSSRSAQSSHRNVLDENEPFNISRESFDSYRRSFDISARTPVADCSSPSMRPRQSLDVRHMRFPSFSTQASMTTDSASGTPSLNTKPSYSFPRFTGSSTEVLQSAPTSSKTIQINAPSSQPEEPILEHADENLDKFEEVGLNDPKPKHRGIFARFGGNSTTTEEKERPNSSTGNHMSFFGRKRGQSNVGSELGAMSKPGARPASSGRQAANSVSSVQGSQPLTPSRTQTPVPATAIAAPPPPPAAKAAAATPAPAVAVAPAAPAAPAQEAKVDA